MADTRLSDLTPFTPVLTDFIYGVDDPAGTPASGALTLQSVLTLFEANISITESQVSDLGSYLTDLSGDTTPQLGGNLDVNGNSIVSVSNGNITLAPNGTGNVVLGNFTFDADQTVGAGQDNYVFTYDNATGLISLEAAAGGGGGSPGGSSGDIQFNDASSFGGSYLKQGTNLIEQRNGTNAQEFRLYNTYTDASNYECLTFEWSTTFVTIGTEGAGTGNQREIYFDSGSQYRFRLGGFTAYRLTSTGFRPETDAAEDLGTTSARWAQINLSGAVTFGDVADHPETPATGLHQLWVRSSDNKLIFTDEGGTDHLLN